MPEAVATETTDLATQDQSTQLAKSPRSIRDLLQGPEIKAAVAAALPRHMTPERFLRVALNAVMRQPELLNCTKESFFRCLLDLSAYGLEPDGRRAHLIPFKNTKARTVECQLIVDYKGIAELVRRSGDVRFIHADVVYENDEWDFAFGSGAFLKHKPNLADRGDKRIAFYSFVKLRDGSEDFIVFGPAQVEKIRLRSRAKDSGPWVEFYDEMGKKTVFRNHSKWLPLSPEARTVIERDDDFAGADVSDALDAVQALPAADAQPQQSRTESLKEKLKPNRDTTQRETRAEEGGSPKSAVPDSPLHITLLESYRAKLTPMAFGIILQKARDGHPEGFKEPADVPAEVAEQIIFDLEDWIKENGK